MKNYITLSLLLLATAPVHAYYNSVVDNDDEPYGMSYNAPYGTYDTYPSPQYDTETYGTSYQPGYYSSTTNKYQEYNAYDDVDVDDVDYVMNVGPIPIKY